MNKHPTVSRISNGRKIKGFRNWSWQETESLRKSVFRDEHGKFMTQEAFDKAIIEIHPSIEDKTVLHGVPVHHYKKLASGTRVQMGKKYLKRSMEKRLFFDAPSLSNNIWIIGPSSAYDCDINTGYARFRSEKTSDPFYQQSEIFLKNWNGEYHHVDHKPENVVNDITERLAKDEEKELAQQIVESGFRDLSFYVASGYLGKHVEGNSIVVDGPDYLVGKPRSLLTNVIEALEYIPEELPHITTGTTTDVNENCKKRGIDRSTIDLYSEAWSITPITSVRPLAPKGMAEGYRQLYQEKWGTHE